LFRGQAGRSSAPGPRHRRSAACVVQRRLIKRVRCRSRRALHKVAFIYQLPRDRFISENPHRFARTQDLGIARPQGVLNGNGTLLVQHKGGIVLIFNFHIEDRAAHGNNGRGGSDLVIVRQSPGMLDLHSDLAQPDFEKISPVSPVSPKNDVRPGKNLKLAAIGNLENPVTIGACDDHLFGLDQISKVQSPGVGVTQN
jgi:hypothetical protein